MQLIDSHLHIWSSDEGRFPSGAEGPGGQTWDAAVETLLGYMDRHGVEQVVAIGPRRYLQDASYLLDATKRYPDRVIPAARVHADDPAA
ncbi:MAG: amidohydrolase, partial [Chloroflexota bacterium]|nr:amidohydrolase [Chloroflexota bacterium]